jgi:hypothetical protein
MSSVNVVLWSQGHFWINGVPGACDRILSCYSEAASILRKTHHPHTVVIDIVIVNK